MMQWLRNSAFSRYLWLLLVIYFVNISVDAVNPDSNIFPENIPYNEQESIAEILVEKILGFENAIAESEDHEPEERQSEKLQKINFNLVVKDQIDISGFIQSLENSNFPLSTKNTLERAHFILIPPPKA
ncbi:hypothetical protein JM79_0362 [Gramella sp. Hel_I_59]|jgi:hypothetical protein|uniref:hypothetical protein n=1 Tax=Gramella sp. Hel_I_59 TaxID=1249978 RepID=UPI0011541880|nr:hypothetical protein [Gramella sp. Hel_I_59]TQI69482.1 hypothetical protein JM79_0362 [Gramella sp. Hel_I_59]